MKTIKIILITSIISFFSSNPLVCHKEPTHQFIVKEAYNLLKKQLGCDIPTLSVYIGYDQGQTTDYDDYAFADTYVVSGAWDEDHHDIVFNYDKSIFTSLVPIFGNDAMRYAFASISHFWAPDDFNTANFLEIKNNFYDLFKNCGWYYPVINVCDKFNALKKSKYYENGNWTLRYGILKNLEPCFYEEIEFKGIINMFNSLTWHIKYCKIDNVESYNFSITPANSFRYLIVFNVLGRLCHLLGDMSIPAHTHIDAHVPPGTTEYYEEKACVGKGYTDPFITYWSSEKIFADKGGFINSTCAPTYTNQDPIEYLFYTTAQIADHFASRRKSGNNNYEDIGEISDIIYDDEHSAHPGPTTSTNWDYDHSDEDLAAIRDATFPYVVRATAGLLYWFATNTGLLRNDGCFADVGNLKELDLKGKNYVFKYSDKLNSGILDGTSGFVFEGSVRNAHFVAGNEIKLSTGFEARLGCDFEAHIAPCENCSDFEKNPYHPQ